MRATITLAIFVTGVFVYSPLYGAQSSSLCTAYFDGKTDDPAYQDVIYLAAGSPADACVQRIATRLASAPDGAEVIAKAAVIACKFAIEKEAKEASDKDNSVDRTRGITQRLAEEQALLAVITVRAGHCAP
jgi:hypothetical protein